MKLTFFPAVFLLLALSARAQFNMNEKIVDVRVVSSQDKIIRGEEFKLAIILNISPTLHINSNKPLGDFLIPTEVKFTPLRNISFQPQFPAPKLKKFAFSDEKLSIYDGEIIVVVSVATSPELDLSLQTIRGVVSYQGCNDQVCFAPEEQNFEIALDVVATGTAVQSQYDEYFSQIESTTADNNAPALTRDERAALQYVEKGMLGAILTFFIIGLALNLTPCVYPVIPLTVSYFGGQSEKSRGSAFAAALLYQIGIALAFAALGLISGLAGKQWGFLFTSPWFVVVIATIILLMSASLFGVFEITVPSWLLTKVSKNKKGVIGGFFMGLTAGILIAPCAAGIIIGLVGLIAKLGLAVKGTILFFVLGLGLGLPYLILATFSSLLGRLPQSGGWMLWIKKVFGFMLIGVAIYFILPQLEHVTGKLGFLVGLTTITAGFLLGFLEHGMYGKTFSWIRKILGIVLIVLGINWIHGALHAKKSEINWLHYGDQTIDMLLEEEKPIFIDFYADWCAPCKQLDRQTFTDKIVIEIAESFVMLKVDCTKPEGSTQAFMDRFRVTGMPTLVFLTKSGAELDELREIGFVPPDKFVSSMQMALEIR